MGAIIKENSQIAVKDEATQGTKETLAGADFLQAFGFGFTPEIENHAREVMSGNLSNFQSIKGRRLGKCNFSVRLKGSGTAGTAPNWGKVLKACGFSETIVGGTSVTYLPASLTANISSVTIGIWIDGVLFQMWGCRGNAKIKMVAGQAGQIDFEFQGANWSFTDASLLASLTPMTTKSQPFLSASYTYQTFAECIENLDIDMGNVLQPDSDINTASGYKLIEITKRRPIGSTDPRMELVATNDNVGKFSANTAGVLTYALTGSAGNIITVNIPQATPASLSQSDRNGIMSWGQDFELDRNSQAGNDELSLALT